jgi:competence protein CoiA
MQYALVEGLRHVPEPNLKGVCPVCSEPAVSKCGPLLLWHWAHLGKRHCDPWWENETDWHRTWKSKFPPECREVVHFDNATGEKHVADVKTHRGVVVEFQNSPISVSELRARELFYGQLLWIVNGVHFAAQFAVLHALPDPRSGFAQDLIFYPARINRSLTRNARLSHGIFWRKSENLNKQPGDLVEVHSTESIKSEIEREYIGHHQFEWVRPRTVWFESTAPVFLDFGDDTLWHLQEYDPNIRCVQRVPKQKLIETLL